MKSSYWCALCVRWLQWIDRIAKMWLIELGMNFIIDLLCCAINVMPTLLESKQLQREFSRAYMAERSKHLEKSKKHQVSSSVWAPWHWIQHRTGLAWNSLGAILWSGHFKQYKPLLCTWLFFVRIHLNFCLVKKNLSMFGFVFYFSTTT